jgi:hypothetical protein
MVQQLYDISAGYLYESVIDNYDVIKYIDMTNPINKNTSNKKLVA